MLKWILRYVSHKARNADQNTRELIILLLLRILFDNLDILAQLAHKSKTPLDDKVIEFLRRLKESGLIPLE